MSPEAACAFLLVASLSACSVVFFRQSHFNLNPARRRNLDCSVLQPRRTLPDHQVVFPGRYAGPGETAVSVRVSRPLAGSDHNDAVHLCMNVAINLDDSFFRKNYLPGSCLEDSNRDRSRACEKAKRRYERLGRGLGTKPLNLQERLEDQVRSVGQFDSCSPLPDGNRLYSLPRARPLLFRIPPDFPFGPACLQPRPADRTSRARMVS